MGFHDGFSGKLALTNIGQTMEIMYGTYLNMDAEANSGLIPKSL
jgi:hypothetical protein